MATTMTVEQKIIALKKAIKACKERGDNYDLLQAKLNQLTSGEKKNLEESESQPAAIATPPKPFAEPEQPRAAVNPPVVNAVEPDRGIPLPSVPDSTTMKDQYYFIDLESGIQFRLWKDRLRQKLLNFLLVENPRKKQNKKLDVDFYVKGCLNEIYRLIEKRGRDEYKESLRNRKYSIGSKRVEEIMGHEVSFGFDYEELKKQFKF